MRVVNDGAEVVTAGADGRVLTWRVDERTGNDLDATPREEIALETSTRSSTAQPVIRARFAAAGEPGLGANRKHEPHEPKPKNDTSRLSATPRECLRGDLSGGGRVVSKYPGKEAPPARPSSAAAAAIFGGGGAAVVFGRNATAPDAGRFPRKTRAPTPWALTDRGVEAEGPLEDGSEPKRTIGAQGSRTPRPVLGIDGGRFKTTVFLRRHVGVRRVARRPRLGARARRRPRRRAASARSGVEPSRPERLRVGRRVRRGEGVGRIASFASRRPRLGPRRDRPESARRFVGRSVAFSPDGRLLAVGAADGRVVVLDARTLADVARAQAGAAAPRARVGWSPSRCSRGRVGVFPGRDAPRRRRRRPPRARLRQRRRRVRAGRAVRGAQRDGHARSTERRRGGAPELLRERRAFVLASGARVRADVLGGDRARRRDAAWATHRARGLRDDGGVGEGGWGAPTPRVVTLDRANGGTSRSGDDLGARPAAALPVRREERAGRTARAHGGSVAAVRFSADDEWLAAAGGADGALMMWRTSGMEGAKKSPTLEGPIR